MINEIGGFLGLEVINSYPKSDLYSHKNAILLNSARSGIGYILETKIPKKIYIPFYSCNSILEPITKNNIKYEFYHIDKDFIPIISEDIKESYSFLYINYFGLNDKTCLNLSKKIKNLIIDNTQAFFSLRINNVDSIYSPRKFFGVSDGGMLYTNIFLNKELEEDYSYDNFDFLLKRIDTNAQESYNLFLNNEKKLKYTHIKKMSKLTKYLLKSIDYEYIKLIRERNFLYLHSLLSKYNKLNIDLLNMNGPMSYPLLIKNGSDLKDILISKKIYIPTYWKEVIDRVNKNSFESYLVNNLVCIPIDQRYTLEDMKYIYTNIENLL